MIAGEPILAIDTATTRVIVAIGQLDGTILEATDWPAGYRHGETLLPAIDQSLMRLGVERSRIGGVVVGTGPGAFTGLRVGLATAKGLAQALQIPIVGVSTADAILAAAPEGSVLLLPAGPSDRLIARRGGLAQLLPAGSEPDLAAHETLVAVDLEGRAPDDAIARGELARSVLGRSMLRLGGALLTAGDVDDVAMLVPDYVTLPRGVQSESGEVAWSHDRR
jgi:tRNA threonylcarbamoyladenosine biosynthesis protein TsaB